MWYIPSLINKLNRRNICELNVFEVSALSKLKGIFVTLTIFGVRLSTCPILLKLFECVKVIKYYIHNLHFPCLWKRLLFKNDIHKDLRDNIHIFIYHDILCKYISTNLYIFFIDVLNVI